MLVWWGGGEMCGIMGGRKANERWKGKRARSVAW